MRIRQILKFFNQPAVYVILLIMLGILLIILKFTFVAKYPSFAEGLQVIGVTILGSGIFSAVTKAFLYGGIFREAILETLNSDIFAERLDVILGSNQIDHLGVKSFARRFDIAVNSILTSKNSIDQLDIFAHSSSKYFTTIRNTRLSVKKVRLLVLKDIESSDTLISIPSTAKDARNEIHTTIGKWLAAKNDGAIEDIEIRMYNFLPTMHFMVVDGRAAMFGFFHLVNSFPGVSTLTNFVVHKEHVIGDQMLTDLQTLFNDIFANRSEPWPESIKSSSQEVKKKARSPKPKNNS